MRDLTGLFDPDHVAVVGATERPGSVGRAVMENLLADFDGDVFPVNPNRETVLGRECHADVGALPADAESVLAVVVVPASVVVDVVRQVGDAGIDDVVVITAGFAEIGGEGTTRQQELATVAETYDLDLVGPNCVGILSTPNGLNASFAPENALPGQISLMSQSGAFVTATLDWAADNDVGFKDVVSMGNEAVLDAEDFVRHWSDDPETAVILGYLEQIRNGREFVDTARAVTKSTPLVVIKSGQTEAGARAASSHTGALAGSAAAYRAGLKQAGAIQVDDVESFFDFGQILADQPLPDSETVAIVTNAGGEGVLTTDAVGESRLSLATFGDETEAEITKHLPAEGRVNNPLDIIGDADVERYRAVLDAVLADDGVGTVIALAAPAAVLDFEELARSIVDLHETHAKPIVTCLMGGKLVHSAVHQLGRRAIPNYFSPRRAVRSVDALARYREITEREYQDPTEFDVDVDRARDVLLDARRRGTTALGVESMALLDAYGIPTPEAAVVDDADEAASIARDLGGPVVLKVVSPDVLHKSDIGGVAVDIEPEDVASVYVDLVRRVKDHESDATILGVQVQEMVDTSRGQELIVGANRDAQFGPLLMFGLGGIFVQVFKDTTVRVAPVSEREARAMTEEITAAPLLRGARGQEPLDVDGVVETIQRLSQLVMDFPAISELDVNPLVALPEGVVAVDLRLTCDPVELDRLQDSS